MPVEIILDLRQYKKALVVYPSRSREDMSQDLLSCGWNCVQELPKDAVDSDWTTKTDHLRGSVPGLPLIWDSEFTWFHLINVRGFESRLYHNSISSVGQSASLMSLRSWVRTPHGVFNLDCPRFKVCQFLQLTSLFR